MQQLNLLRHSQSFLTGENKQLKQRAQTSEARVAALESEVEPLAEKLRVQAADRASLEAELEAQRSDSQRWKDRADSILHRCNLVDPGEHKRLQAAEVTLKAEVETLRGDLTTCRKVETQAKASLESADSALAAVRQPSPVSQSPSLEWWMRVCVFACLLVCLFGRPFALRANHAYQTDHQSVFSSSLPVWSTKYLYAWLVRTCCARVAAKQTRYD